MIPHSRPVFGKAFEDALIRVVESGYVAMGSEARLLEREVARRIRKEGAVAVDSGTSAITLALRAVAAGGVMRKGGRVGIPAYTCSSVLYAALAAGFEPVCMDCGEDLCLIPEQALAQAASLDAVIIVHPFGMVEPMAAETWPCPVIEDIAQAAGAELNGRPVGSFGDVTIASFYATKPWGGAYGGIAASDDHALCEAIKAMRDPDEAVQLQDYAGHHQLSDLHACMANARLQSAADEQSSREALAHVMDGWFYSGTAVPVAGMHQGNRYRYIIRTTGEAESVINRLMQHGVAAARPVTTPVSRLLGVDAPGAEKAWLDAVSLPVLADISETELGQFKAAVESCIS
ncbi:MAG: DegT/DnrJ/EryC1/StrS family aminotransferase [Mariprofundaceae bacterium]|nr:DegT/DnrJ/EryC1/StrS family aminotransferase [Mariprofundaceae bacterium]